MSTNLKQKFVLVSCFDDFPFSFVVVVVVLHFSLGDRVKTKHHILSQSEVKSIPIVTCALALGYDLLTSLSSYVGMGQRIYVL